MFRLFFGSPGCGKTTYACKLLKDNSSKYKHVFANFNTSICPTVNLNSLGTWTFPEDSYIVIDEAGIEYNNRKFKSLPQCTIEWFKLHRHYKCDVDFISQSWEDVDITVRRLVDEVWYIRKVGPLSICRKVFKRIVVDKKPDAKYGDIVEGYTFAKTFPLLIMHLIYGKRFIFVWRPLYYKYFDTYSCPRLPVRYGKNDLPEISSYSDPVSSHQKNLDFIFKYTRSIINDS